MLLFLKETFISLINAKNNGQLVQLCNVTYSIVHYLSWISFDDLCFTSFNLLQKLIELWAICTESLEYICQILTIFNIFAKYQLYLIYLPNINYICSSTIFQKKTIFFIFVNNCGTMEVQVICTGVVITDHKTNGGTCTGDGQ